MRQKSDLAWRGGGEGDAPNRLFMKGVGLCVSVSLSLSAVSYTHLTLPTNHRV